MFTPDQFDVIDSVAADDGTTVDVLQYRHLSGSANVRTAEMLFFANQSGMRLKMVRIRLSNSHIRLEPGAIHFMKGQLEMKTSTGGGVLKGLARKLVSGETFFVNELHGTGEIYLEPSFGHFLLHRIDKHEGAVIVDKGLFFAGTAGLTISAAAQKNVSSALFGGEGLFQTAIAGTGVAILYSPVPASEIQKLDLHDDKLWVDGDFAMMRSVGLNFRAEKSSKSWVATSVSGEGLLQTFEGSGSVWLAPTKAVYDRLASPTGLATLAQPPVSPGTHVDKKS